jgi:hypothetical protein
LKKNLTLAIVFELREYPGQAVFYIRLTNEAMLDWCLGLCLLQTRLVDTLLVKERGGKRGIEVQVLWTADRAARARADFKHEMSRLELTPIQLDSLTSFFLKYYRDGIAAVDHMDLEAIAVGTESEDAYITLVVPDYAPPVSPEEAERRLNKQ